MAGYGLADEGSNPSRCTNIPISLGYPLLTDIKTARDSIITDLTVWATKL